MGVHVASPTGQACNLPVILEDIYGRIDTTELPHALYCNMTSPAMLKGVFSLRIDDIHSLRLYSWVAASREHTAHLALPGPSAWRAQPHAEK